VQRWWLARRVWVRRRRQPNLDFMCADRWHTSRPAQALDMSGSPDTWRMATGFRDIGTSPLSASVARWSAMTAALTGVSIADSTAAVNTSAGSLSAGPPALNDCLEFAAPPNRRGRSLVGQIAPVSSRTLPLELPAPGPHANNLALFAALNDSFESTATNRRECCSNCQKPAG
jgi:hypothetical protein